MSQCDNLWEMWKSVADLSALEGISRLSTDDDSGGAAALISSNWATSSDYKSLEYGSAEFEVENHNLKWKQLFITLKTQYKGGFAGSEG